jgi:mannose-6-phosphate isomerase-like protein (cupin superfamily)
MKPTIRPVRTDAEFYTPEKCYIMELSNRHDDPDASIARARVVLGETTRWHRLVGTTERYYIVHGTAQVEVGDLPPQQVNAGDVVIIPPMCWQRITNLGKRRLDLPCDLHASILCEYL